MKVWVWQRLWKELGQEAVYSELRPVESDYFLRVSDPGMRYHGHIWLCPKPCLVLVDRKHLGGAE